MKSKDQVLLEQAYLKIVEDAQDASADSQLKKALRDIIVGHVKRGSLSEGLVERNVDQVVDEMFGPIQDHVEKAKNQAHEAGMEDFKDMDQFYRDEEREGRF